eukprot:2249775-Prymnesium_polylepis.1
MGVRTPRRDGAVRSGAPPHAYPEDGAPRGRHGVGTEHTPCSHHTRSWLGFSDAHAATKSCATHPGSPPLAGRLAALID